MLTSRKFISSERFVFLFYSLIGFCCVLVEKFTRENSFFEFASIYSNEIIALLVATLSSGIYGIFFFRRFNKLVNKNSLIATGYGILIPLLASWLTGTILYSIFCISSYKDLSTFLLLLTISPFFGLSGIMIFFSIQTISFILLSSVAFPYLTGINNKETFD